MKQLQVCNDFSCDEPVCEDNYFDLIFLVHQSENGKKGKQNWTFLTRFLKKIIKSFAQTNPGLESYRVALVQYGAQVVSLLKLDQFDGNRDAIFETMDSWPKKKSVINNKKSTSLGNALQFVETEIVRKNTSGRRPGGFGGVPAILMIITDELETSPDERTKSSFQKYPNRPKDII